MDNNWQVAELQIKYKKRKKQPVIIKSTLDAVRVLLKHWDIDLMNIQEQYCALYLDTQGEALAFRLISTGRQNDCGFDMKLLLSCGLLCRAHSLIVAHNHPSGSLKVSSSDKETTIKLKSACELVGLHLIDSLIITDKGFVSI